MYECYVERKFTKKSERIIELANEIIQDYNAQGFSLTLRQLYYQFVSRDLIRNSQAEYKSLGSIINDARLAGLIDWEAIEDRTRNVRSNPHWRGPEEILRAVAQQFSLNKRVDQPNYIEVWIEKDALVGLLDGVCSRYDVPYFSCRGYTSQSEMWSAAMRMIEAGKRNQSCYVLHLGDHDPSGIDMSRDIEERLNLFFGHHMGYEGVEVRRLALNMPQVKKFNPPPNPAKSTDARFVSYRDKYGMKSWELDALEPSVIVDIIDKEILELTDMDSFNDVIMAEGTHRDNLGILAASYSDIINKI